MDWTSPICTPRNFTFAPFSMTRPDLSETTVSVSKDRAAPENSTTVSALTAITTANSTGAHQMGSMPPRRGELMVMRDPASLLAPPSPSARQVEVAGLPVDGQRDGQQDEDARGDRGPHRTADGLADTGRSSGGGVAVVGVHGHDRGGHRQCLHEGPQQIG